MLRTSQIPPEEGKDGAQARRRRPAAGSYFEPAQDVPVQGWFQRDLKRYARAHLLSRRARIRPYINQNVVREWLDYRGNLWPRHGVKLWHLLTLELWLRVNE